MLEALIAGYTLGFSLIMAIGAQNAFVLRQGLEGNFVLPLVLVCASSDAILIFAGVAGFGVLVAALPWVLEAIRWAGAGFLFVYGCLSFRSALKGGYSLTADPPSRSSAAQAVATCLLLTWTNPHVYLDTVVLLGGVSASYDAPWGFGLGAAVASFSFFFLLGFGARLLRPVFASPRAWRVLDVAVALIMWGIAWQLLLRDFHP